MPWTVEVTDQFESWWDLLTEDERISVDGMIRVLEAQGPAWARRIAPSWPSRGSGSCGS